MNRLRSELETKEIVLNTVTTSEKRVCRGSPESERTWTPPVSCTCIKKGSLLGF